MSASRRGRFHFAPISLICKRCVMARILRSHSRKMIARMQVRRSQKRRLDKMKRTYMKAIVFGLGIVAGAALMAARVNADEWNEKTIFTFSAPVEIPGQ